MDISFIIPIYNTSTNELERCFDSINGISREVSYEVLIVDDGSDQFVEEFCKEYIEAHSKFIYYRQEHVGVSEARNYGMEKASGENIAFIDSDDYILAEIYNKRLVLEKSDLMVFDMEHGMKDGRIIYCDIIPNKNTGIYDRLTLFEALENNSVVGGVYAKLFKRKMLIDRKIKFDTEMQSGEDADFILQIILAINSFIYVKKPAYRYIHANSNWKKRLIENPQKALRSIEKGFNRKKSVLGKLEMQDELREMYLKRLNKNGAEAIMHISGQLLLQKNMNDALKEQINKDMHAIDKKSLSFFSMSRVQYMLIEGRHWNLVALYERVRLIWAEFKYKHLEI